MLYDILTLYNDKLHRLFLNDNSLIAHDVAILLIINLLNLSDHATIRKMVYECTVIIAYIM